LVALCATTNLWVEMIYFSSFIIPWSDFLYNHFLILLLCNHQGSAIILSLIIFYLNWNKHVNSYKHKLFYNLITSRGVINCSPCPRNSDVLTFKSAKQLQWLKTLLPLLKYRWRERRSVYWCSHRCRGSLHATVQAPPVLYNQWKRESGRKRISG
jgi:hypothetical protein